MGAIDWVAYVLVIIGALNWGLVAVGTNVVDSLGSTVARVVYALVGLSAVWMIYKAFKM